MLNELKDFLKGEFQKVIMELKDIRQNINNLDIRLSSIAGKLNGIEVSVGKLQG